MRQYAFDDEAKAKKHQFVFFLKPECTVSPKLPVILAEVMGAFKKAGVGVGAIRIMAVLHIPRYPNNPKILTPLAASPTYATCPTYPTHSTYPTYPTYSARPITLTTMLTPP